MANSKDAKRFKIALSFPGEKRNFVKNVAESLCKQYGKDKIFYDKHFEAELARPNLDTYLQDIYQNQSDLIVVFLCKEYDEKEWCGLELRAIRELIKHRMISNIMFFRFDETVMPGILSIDGYIEIDGRLPDEISELICERYKINYSVSQIPATPIEQGIRTGKAILHNLPYISIGDLFKGREEVLGRLKRRLDSHKTSAITQTIEGLGGIGKTRLAIEFAWWAIEEKKYKAIFFVSAETPESIGAGLARLASKEMLDFSEQTVDEQTARTLSLGWLKENKNWLMILDNADNKQAADEVEKLLPHLANGHTIITSRYRRWSGAVMPEPLGLLTLEKATEFLLERTDRRRTETRNDKSNAEKLAKELGYLPLALEQAAAYIAHNQETIAEYIQEWEAEKGRVLEWFDEREMNYPASAGFTLQKTFDELSIAAQTILRLACFLAPEPVPIKMFEQGSKIIIKAMKLNEKNKSTNPAKKIDTTDVIGELASYSMINRQKDTFTVHRIVQEVIRCRIDAKKWQGWVEKALKIVNNFTPCGADDVRTWPIWDILRPHAEVIAKAADAAKITKPTSRLMNELGVYLSAKGLYAKSEFWKIRSLEMYKKSLGENHPNVAVCLNNLAQLYHDTNRFKEAEPLMKRALEIDEKAFGKDHPNVARDLNNLAQLYQETNRSKEAEPLMNRALTIDEKAFGKDHPNFARDLNNLAMLYKDTNRYAEAKPLLERALTILENSLGQDHPKTILVRENLEGI